MESVYELRKLIGDELVEGEPMSRHTTLKVGGTARWFWAATTVEQLVAVLEYCQLANIPYLFIGHGSNLLVSDRGYRGLVIQNKCKRIDVGPVTMSETGATLGSLFQQTAKAGYSGLEWAVGIPGTVGGALVSNAGAYRGNVGPLVRSVRIFHDGRDQTVSPDWMEFSYRDSRLRRNQSERAVLLACTLELKYEGDADAILERSKFYQDQRRTKQPFDPSAGSFFKNVNNAELANSLSTLPGALKAAGVVPAGFLIEACGLKGERLGGAQMSEKHANFLVNVGGATATDIRNLASVVKQRVYDRFGVTLEEEVLYAGDWAE
ncbi:MAG: UDP-N-acetylmuramate dehydrogenase [Capsulimonadaceae bacterium]|nr:UDP-N-acetylmuramate dehydrogenase [Capsulimonadaceae bacterium]